MAGGCIFCKIAAHDAPAKIEYESEDVVAFPSISPASQVHLIIVPKDHIENIFDLEEQNKEVWFDMMKAVRNLIEKKGIAGGYKLVINGGKYQSIPHIHWHLLGGKWNEGEEKDVVNKT